MKALKAKKQILRTQISNARSRNNERQLERALQRYFKSLEKQIQRNLQFYWQDNLVMGQVDLITEPITNTHQEYYEIIEKYLLREYELGSQEAKRLVLRLNKNRVANKAKVKKPKQNPNLQNEFTKDFYTLVSRAEGTQGIELKPIYNKLKRKYKSKVKNRAEFERLFTNAVMGTSTRLYPSRDPDMFVKIGGRNFGYIDRRNLTKPKLTEPVVEESEVEEQKVTIPKPVETDTPFKIDDQYNLFGTLSGAEDDLLNRTFEASMGTLMRVDQSIKDIITDGYKTGYGINYVSNKIRERFGQLHGWESKRIARTEIHNAHNQAVMDTYKEYDVQYTMWISAHDKRVRGLKKGDKADHVKLDGEIIRLGDTYSNGLKYPGDTDGPIEEWINCRCSNAPFVLPYGYAAPPTEQFTENDLIKIR